MIASAALFSVAPMAIPSGKGATSTQGTSGAGGFAELLQKSQTSREAAALDRSGSGDNGHSLILTSSTNSGEAGQPAGITAGETEGKDVREEAAAEAHVLQRGKGDEEEALPEESQAERGMTPEGDASGAVKKEAASTGETTKVQAMAAGILGDLVGGNQGGEADVADAGEAAGKGAGEVDVESRAASGASGNAAAEECGEGDNAVDVNGDVVRSHETMQTSEQGAFILAGATVVAAQPLSTAAGLYGPVREGEGTETIPSMAGLEIETVASNAGTVTVGNELEVTVSSTAQDPVVKEKVKPEAESVRQSAWEGDVKVSSAGGKDVMQRAVTEISNNSESEGAGSRKGAIPEGKSSPDGQVTQSRTAQQNVRATAGSFVATQAPELSFKGTTAADATAMNQVARNDAPTASTPLQQEVIVGITAAAPIVVEQVSQDAADQTAKAASMTETTQQQTSASSATKVAPGDATAPGEVGEAGAAAASDGSDLLAEGDETIAARTSAATDKTTEASARSLRHESEPQRMHSVQKEPAKQEAVKSGDAAGSTESDKPSTAPSIKTAASQANAEQKRSSDGGQNPDSRQKAQVEQTAQVPAPGIGARIEESTATETGAGHSRSNQSKSTLQQSILSQVRDGVVTRDAKGNGEMSIRLHPNELGELKIQVRMEDNRLRIDVQAENRMVKDLLVSNLDSLKEALSGKNFTVDGFDVSAGGGSFNSSLSEQKANPQQQTTPRLGKVSGYGESETRLNYVTEKANSLLSVRL